MKDGYYVVKPWLLMVDQYGLGLTEDEVIDCECWFYKVMEKIVPKGRVIQVVDNKWKGYNISDDMLMGPYLEYGEKCLVRDSAEYKWKEYYFVGYRPGSYHPVIVRKSISGTNWEYYRNVKKIEQPTETRQKVFDENHKFIGYLEKSFS